MGLDQNDRSQTKALESLAASVKKLERTMDIFAKTFAEFLSHEMGKASPNPFTPKFDNSEQCKCYTYGGPANCPVHKNSTYNQE